MPKTRRQRVEPSDDWEQLQLLSRFPERITYELIRPVVLFGHSPAERARETGTPECTLYRLRCQVHSLERAEHEVAKAIAGEPAHKSATLLSNEFTAWDRRRTTFPS